MKKIPYSVFLIGSLFITTLTLSAIAFLANLNIKPDGLNLELLIHGNVLQLLLVKEFWSQYPAFPAVNLLFLPPNAFILMALLLGSVIYLAYRQKYHPLIISAALLSTALIPYGFGLIALAKNERPENAGVWLAFMLVGMFYSALTCALFNGFQIAKRWSTPVLVKG
jgi:hypothetical protein